MSNILNIPPLSQRPVGLRQSGWLAMTAKEWKQNLKWAALGVVGLSLALAFSVSRAAPYYNTNADVFATVWSGVTTILTISAPLFGLALGLLQTIPELKRDLWAFLIHRPASRSTIFWGKVTAGLGLYLLATLLPFLGVALWARAPGHLPAPFDWGFTLGSLGAVLAGVTFYFAGLLTGLRPARWWGSRALPVAAAVLVAGLVAGGVIFEFRFAVALTLTAGAVFCLAAHGSFLTTGLYEKQPRLSRAALGGVLYAGLVVTVTTLFVLGVNGWQTLFPSPPYSWPPQPEYHITRMGRVVRVTNIGSNVFRDVRDSHGTPIPGPRRAGFNGNDFLSLEHLLPSYRIEREQSYSNPRRYVVENFSDTNEENWYYVQCARQLVGFSTHTRRQIGVFGPRGFAPTGADPEKAGRFPGSLRAFVQPLLAFDHSLYRVKPYARSAWAVQSVPTGEPILDLSMLVPPPLAQVPPGFMPGNTPDWSAARTYFIVMTSRQALVYSHAGRPLFAAPIGGYPNSVNSVDAALTSDGQRVIIWEHNSGRGPDRVTVYALDGTVVSRDLLPPLPHLIAPDTSLLYLFGLAIPPPVATALRLIPDWGRVGWYPFFALSVIAGLLAAVLSWLIGRRCAYGRFGKWAWAVGTFFLGLWGVLLLLSLRDWPAREACSNCGRPRVVDREQCEHCGAGFPDPPRDGTEIFEEQAGPRLDRAIQFSDMGG